MIGIYTITNLITNKIYVGCSIHINFRITKHKQLLKSNKHYDNHLQSAYNKYGKENFVFEVLEECGISLLYSQETYWINMLDVLNENYGYNIAPPNPLNAKTHVSNETRLKMGIASSKKIFTEEYRKKLSNASNHLTPVTAKPILRIEDNKEYKSISDAAKEINCHNTTVWKQLNNITKTCKGYTFKYLDK